jgi:hypothetical protein
MKKLSKLVLVLALAFFVGGCLFVEKRVYTIALDSPTAGTATVVYHDIRSNAIGNKEFAEDADNLFYDTYEHPDFIEFWKRQGVFVKERELWTEGEKLQGKLVLAFDDVSNVENMQYDGEFYYLTLGADDSVMATNGVVIPGEGYTRVLWEAGTDTLRFSIYEDRDTYSRSLAPEFRKRYGD